jgi:DNA-directed RNA polymerase specialized sigma24 family protein
MLGSANGSEAAATRQGLFATTHWSVVLQAGSGESPHAAAALEHLCRAYWYPLYAYVRRRGYGPEDAQDLTQEFFARLLARNDLAAVDRKRGRFRSYLLGALNHFLADDWDRRHRLKRGGQTWPVPFDAASGEGHYALEPIDERSPDRLFERRWALALLDLVWRQLQREHQAGGKERLFARLSVFLPGEAEGEGYRQAAEELQMTEGATRVAVHRLRQRYGELFRQAVADTVEDPAEIPDEMRHLVEVLSS